MPRKTGRLMLHAMFQLWFSPNFETQYGLIKILPLISDLLANRTPRMQCCLSWIYWTILSPSIFISTRKYTSWFPCSLAVNITDIRWHGKEAEAFTRTLMKQGDGRHFPFCNFLLLTRQNNQQRNDSTCSLNLNLPIFRKTRETDYVSITRTMRWPMRCCSAKKRHEKKRSATTNVELLKIHTHWWTALRWCDEYIPNVASNQLYPPHLYYVQESSI